MKRTTSHQIKTVPTTIKKIMASAAFRRGVEDKRAGRAPAESSDWDYERGRQWATIAPPDMPVMIGSKVNPEAELLFWRERGII